MGFKRLDDVVAYQFAIEFKTEVYRLIRGSPEARADFKFRAQLREAASGVDACQAEGFYRYRPADTANFLTYALASLGEAVSRLEDGILRDYFSADECAAAFTWARRCKAATRGWHASQLRLIADQREKKRHRRDRSPPPVPRRRPRKRRNGHTSKDEHG